MVHCIAIAELHAFLSQVCVQENQTPLLKGHPLGRHCLQFRKSISTDLMPSESIIKEESRWDTPGKSVISRTGLSAASQRFDRVLDL